MGTLAIALCLSATPVFAQNGPGPAASTGPASSATGSIVVGDGGQAAGLPIVTLEEALAAAAANGPSLKIAGYSLKGAEAQHNQAKARAGLALSGTASYFHEDNLPNQPQPSTTSFTSSSGAAAQAAIAAEQAAIQAGTAAPIGENIQGALSLAGPATSLSLSAHYLLEEGTLSDQVTSFSLTGSQTVYDGYPGGRAAATLKEADYAYQTAQVSYGASALQIAYQVKQSYYTLLGGQQAVLVQQANVHEAQEDVTRVRGFLSVGEATPLDLQQAEVALRQAQLSLKTAENQVVIDRRSLSAAVGWPLGRVYQVPETPGPAIRASTESAALPIAFANRPELKELSLNVATAEVALALAKAQYFPVVSLKGSLSLDADLTTGYTSGTYNAGIAVSFPIFENGLLAAQVNQAKSQLASLSVQQDQERQSITIAVQNALFAVNQDEATVGAAQQSLSAAEGQYALQKAKFAAGLATNLDVLTASASLMSAQNALVQAKTNYILAILNLDNALGI